MDGFSRRSFVLKLSCMAGVATALISLGRALAHSRSFRLEIVVNRARSILPYPIVRAAILSASGKILLETGRVGTPSAWLRTNDFGGVSVNVSLSDRPDALVVDILVEGSDILTARCQMDVPSADVAYYLVEPMLRNLNRPEDGVYPANESSVLSAAIVLAGIKIASSPEFPSINSVNEPPTNLART